MPALLATVSLLVGGCDSAPVPRAAPTAFPGSAPSLEELGRTVVEALEADDTAALEPLRLTGPEHNEVVWPELPASNPSAGFPVEEAWSNIERRNRAALDRLVRRLRSRGLAYRSTECRGASHRFRTFEVHTDCWIVLEIAGVGTAHLQAFEDVLERGGGFKIFRYYDHGPVPGRRTSASASAPEP